MILSSSAYRFTYGDYLQDVSDVFDKTDLNKDDFIQSYLDYCSDGDKTYFVPFQVVGYYMYWNKDLFKKAGLDPETPPTSWDEWQQDAAKISDSTQNIYGSEFLMIMPTKLHTLCRDLGDWLLLMIMERGRLILKIMRDMRISLTCTKIWWTMAIILLKQIRIQ